MPTKGYNIYILYQCKNCESPEKDRIVALLSAAELNIETFKSSNKDKESEEQNAIYDVNPHQKVLCHCSISTKTYSKKS